MGFNTETGFNTTLEQKLDAGVADASIRLGVLPITITEGVMLIGNGTNKEWAYFATTDAGNVEITGCNRGLNKDATSISDTSSANILSHRVGDPVRLVQHSFLQNNQPKLDSSNIFTGALQTFKDILVDFVVNFIDTTTYVKRVGNDMLFKDPNTTEVSLSTLAAAAGTDTKVSVTANDTTPDFLNSKITVANGIKTTEVNDGADEDLLFEIDTTTLPANLAEANTFFGATDATGAEMETLTDESDAGGLHSHAIKIGDDDWNVTGGAQTKTVAHGLGRIPKMLTVTWGTQFNSSNVDSLPNGEFTFDGTTLSAFQRVSGSANNAQFESISSSIRVLKAGTTHFTFTVTTLDATNFIFTSANFSSIDNLSFIWRIE